MANTMEALQAKHEKAKKDLEELEAQISEARRSNATAVFDQIADLLADNAQYFSLAQKNHIKRVLDGDARANRVVSSGSVEPKYQLDTGETWTGRGRTSKKFAEFAASAEGKAWKKANDGQTYPAYPNPKVKK